MKNVMHDFVAFTSSKFMINSILCSALALGLIGCSDSAKESVKKAGESAKETAKNTGDAVKDAAESTGKAVGDTTNKAGEMAKEAGEKMSEGFSAAMEKATSALAGVDGGGELLAKIKDFFSSTQETLSGITSKETAQAAMAKLGDLDGIADSIAAETSKLPEEAQAAVGGVVGSGKALLQALIEKLNAIPGVSDVIKPKLEELMEKLKTIGGE